jgi:hypothetical protein
VQIECDERVLRSDLWRLERTTAGGPGRFPSATVLIESLFPAGAGTLELVKKNATRLMSAHQAHAKILNERLHGSHFNRNVGSIVAATVIGVATAAVAFAVSGGGGVPLIIGVVALMALVVIAFAILVEAPTMEGRKLLDEIAGLKLYLAAERDSLPASGRVRPRRSAERYEALRLTPSRSTRGGVDEEIHGGCAQRRRRRPPAWRGITAPTRATSAASSRRSAAG